MKILYLVGAILLSVSSVTAQEDSIKNFLRVNKEFCTGGQPSLQHLEKLKADGVKAIINLRQPTEYAAAEEEAKAKALGLRYFNIAVSPTEPKDEQATEFLKITDDQENRPAFIHCRSAARVAAFWMIRRVLRDGWKIADAEKEAAKVGLGDHTVLSEFAHKYIESHR
ncbi:MAG TPA: sulfur transferase domain-containing protein [Pyrinomonadaceae bacterium]|nr:sulfur transferase domain-containing protein [Pyrinomonadaceae bacterium]